jgi:hypothetical protein
VFRQEGDDFSREAGLAGLLRGVGFLGARHAAAGDQHARDDNR